jgi:hypothetical protein
MPGIVKAGALRGNRSSIATGLWEYMPYYRVAKLCAWDIGALALIIWVTFRVLRRARRPAAGV